MKRLSMFEFKNYCNNNSFSSFILTEKKSNNVSCSLSFDKLLLSPELLCATFINNEDDFKLTLNDINYIDIDEEYNQVMFVFDCNDEHQTYIFYSKIEVGIPMNDEKNICVCNKCGKKLDIWDRENVFKINGYICYGSDYDGEMLDLKLCCECMDSLINSCKISPIHTL